MRGSELLVELAPGRLAGLCEQVAIDAPEIAVDRELANVRFDLIDRGGVTLGD
jgi:hypothetical protein